MTIHHALLIINILVIGPSDLFAQIPELPPANPSSYGSVNVDLSVRAEPGFYSWGEISTSPTRADYSYLAQRSALNLKVTENPWTFNLRLENIYLSGVAGLPKPLSLVPSRYPQPGPSFFVSQSYLSYQNMAERFPLIVEAGIIPVHVENSLVLDDNGLGILGAHAAISAASWLHLNIYSGNTETNNSQADKVLFHYARISAKRMGVWGLGILNELDKTQRSLSLGTTTGYSRRNYYILTYDQQKDIFNLHTQIIRSDGSYDISGTPENIPITHRASAYLVKGSWVMWLPRLEVLGPVDFGFTYAQGSGDEATTPEDEAFFAPLANRFNGMAKTGWGDLLGATVFDVLPATGTWNGLPQGLSGVATAGFSITTKPHRVMTIPVDLGISNYLFRATNSSALSKDLGSEWAFHASLTLSSRLQLIAKMFTFVPGLAYEIGGVKPDSIKGLHLVGSLSFE
ncbi:MAG: hypothetical protein HY547_01675 [Elusimicrobia bacterium]|nr:hypothetical protein [Elusimicrobiota bacterium]